MASGTEPHLCFAVRPKALRCPMESQGFSCAAALAGLRFPAEAARGSRGRQSAVSAEARFPAQTETRSRH